MIADWRCGYGRVRVVGSEIKRAAMRALFPWSETRGDLLDLYGFILKTRNRSSKLLQDKYPILAEGSLCHINSIECSTCPRRKVNRPISGFVSKCWVNYNAARRNTGGPARWYMAIGGCQDKATRASVVKQEVQTWRCYGITGKKFAADCIDC